VATAIKRSGDRTLYAPAFGAVALTGWLTWRGWHALSGAGQWHTIRAGQSQLAGPIVLVFVLLVVAAEQCRPAQRRPLASRGQLQDAAYLLVHAVLVVPLIILIGTGFSSTLAHAAPWIVLPHMSAAPRWLFVALALVAIDAVDWFVHFVNHALTPLWRLHALHHSQEELSVLTAFRTHPLVHLSFVLSAVPVLALAANAATPTELLTAYTCLGVLPHANLPWGYGKAGRLVVSPSYHRIHHRPEGRLDVNLGAVLTVWDVLSQRAIFPAAGEVPSTGLAGRPIPVEQAPEKRRLANILVAQLAEPFRVQRSLP
jgi:sterol desaturase/sphingolipid hydroxylase (fatty acid hydroxylase superfamily)